MILLLDNFDSFTYNLADYLKQEGVECDVLRNDCDLSEIDDKKYSAILFSPGPGTPEKAGNMMKIIDAFHKKLPLLGICLGHQAIGLYFGAKIKKSIRPMHGKISAVICKEDSIFSGIPTTFNAVRYHSLVVDELPSCLETIATTEEGEIMVMKHRNLPIYGIQYHPEAILTEFGKEILKNWIFCNKQLVEY